MLIYLCLRVVTTVWVYKVCVVCKTKIAIAFHYNDVRHWSQKILRYLCCFHLTLPQLLWHKCMREFMRGGGGVFRGSTPND